MTAIKGAKTPTSIRNVKYEPLPYPLSAGWTAALRSGQSAEMARAFEHVPRFMSSAVWADVLDLEWTAEEQDYLSGGPERRGLGSMGLGASECGCGCGCCARW